MHTEGGPPQLARLTTNVIGTAQYAAPELMNEDLLENMKPDQRYLQVMSHVLPSEGPLDSVRSLGVSGMDGQPSCHLGTQALLVHTSRKAVLPLMAAGVSISTVYLAHVADFVMG
jgi:hypothetical protein